MWETQQFQDARRHLLQSIYAMQVGECKRFTQGLTIWRDGAEQFSLEGGPVVAVFDHAEVSTSSDYFITLNIGGRHVASIDMFEYLKEKKVI